MTQTPNLTTDEGTTGRHSASRHLLFELFEYGSGRTVTRGTRRIFFRGGQIRVDTLGTKVHQRGPGMDLRWGLKGEVPDAKPTTGCENHV